MQPRNCGTAHGILLALLRIERRAPNSIVVLLPADHYLTDETTMARSLRTATNLAADHEGLVYILGAEPDHPDPELGYIVPSARRGEAAAVLRFVERPLPRRRASCSGKELCGTRSYSRAHCGLCSKRLFAASCACDRPQRHRSSRSARPISIWHRASGVWRCRKPLKCNARVGHPMKFMSPENLQGHLAATRG